MWESTVRLVGDDEAAHRALTQLKKAAGSRAADRAWTGMAVREAMMLEPQVPRKDAFHHDPSTLRRLATRS